MIITNTLPDTWSTASISEINKHESNSIQPNKYPDETFELYSVPIFPEGHPELPQGSAIGSSKQTVLPNDVLICKINPRINRVWVVSEKNNYRQIASSEWITIRQPLLFSKYLVRYFQSEEFRGKLCADVTGVGGSLTRAQPKKVATFLIPIPPLPEQKAIAEKLDRLLAQVERSKARLQRLPQILKRFRQSVLAAAVSGKLTEEWRNLNGKEIDEWKPTTIGAIAEVATGKTPKRTNVRYWENGDTPWLTSASTGNLFTHKADQFVTSIAIQECTLKIFPEGTLLLAMYGEGKTRGQVTETKIPATCNQACAAIILNKRHINKKFIKIRLQENYEEIRNVAAGGTQPNLNLKKVRDISVALPPYEEQEEIAHRVEELFTYADKIEQQINSALTKVEQLSQSILAKAFRGELTEQWRRDNPELISGDNSAAALLERIRTQRAGAKATPRKRRKTAPA
ncbi:restriction endonuclease subunit S [Microbulbifer sp. 2304DJ12-6]|uniref:restriction endonuclease subunit S n=1 Tax=Microbulbifer sp. 2304DJ12-6 TaxID=3233340 RepID=UPI0039B125C0